MNALLIFPAITAEAWEQVLLAQREGRPYVLAGSMAEPPAGAPADAVQHWAVLPSIYADTFAQEFAALVARHEVAAVFSPIPTVHAFLRRFLPAAFSRVVLVNEAPIERQVRLLAKSAALASEMRPVERAAAGFGPDAGEGLHELELRAVLDAAMGTYGESGPEKIAAMSGIMASAVRGDVVEIGTLMGRSAVALRLLARRFEIGPVLTVDPWSPVEAFQADSPAGVRDDLIHAWDYDALARGFASRMYALGDTGFAHLRLPSRLGHEQYAGQRELHYPPFRPTRFAGEIAVLHIDGNHDYAAVRDDWQRWSRHLVPGAWVILDDYVWAHGDGPRRLGDEILAASGDLITRHFVLDKALFIHFRAMPAPL